MFIGDMGDESFNEILNGQGHHFEGIGVMVEVEIRDGFTVITLDAGFSDRGAFEISAKVFDIAFVVVRGFTEMDDPIFLIDDIQP